MKSFNHKFINEVQSFVYINIYELIISLFHLQIMSILYFTYRNVSSPTRSSVSQFVNNSLLQC